MASCEQSTTTDSYGRDLEWLARAAPNVRPPQWMFALSAVWPIQAVELWNAKEMLRHARNQK